MSAPDPEGMSLLAKVISAGAALVVPIWGARTWLDRRFAKKADKDETEKESEKCLRHIEKLYENAEKDRALTRDLHDRAMDAVQKNQTTIIGILAGRRE